MSRFSERIRSGAGRFALSIKEFPVEALLGLTYFIIFVFAEKVFDTTDWSKAFTFFLWFFPHYVLTYTLHRFSEGRPVVKWLYFLSWVLWVPLYFLYGSLNSINAPWVVAYILAVILLVIGDRKLDNGPYGRNILRTVVKIAVCFIVGGILMAVVTAIVASFNYLFGLNLKDEWFTYPNVFIAMNFIPLLCCSAVSDGKPLQKGERLLRTVVDGILSPALILYTLILYAYIVRILIRWELPDGGVAYMVASYIGIALLCCLFQHMIGNRHFDWFYRWFPAIAAAPLILLWTGVLRRIGEYGMTGQRFYLLLASALMTLFVAMLVHRKSHDFQIMTLILAAALALFTYIPGISARDFGIRGQQKRLDAVLPQVLEEGRFPEKLDYASISADSTLLGNWKTVGSSWQYLELNMDKDSFEKKYGKYGIMPSWISWTLAGKEQWVEDFTAEPVVYRLEEPVSLGEYTEFIPSGNYHYYEDKQYAIFYSGPDKATVLLQCDIKDRLDSGAEGNEALVYSNDGYLAVFTSVSDYGDNPGQSFTTGQHMLYKKTK